MRDDSYAAQRRRIYAHYRRLARITDDGGITTQLHRTDMGTTTARLRASVVFREHDDGYAVDEGLRRQLANQLIQLHTQIRRTPDGHLEKYIDVYVQNEASDRSSSAAEVRVGAVEVREENRTSSGHPIIDPRGVGEDLAGPRSRAEKEFLGES